MYIKEKITEILLHVIGKYKFTHGNKLGNTFSPWGKFEKNSFSFFLAILKFLSHIFHTLA